MPTKRDIEYEIMPKSLNVGVRWLTMRIKNIGEEKIDDLDIRINSLDTYNIEIQSPGEYISELMPQEELYVHFRISAYAPAYVYFSVDGLRDDEYFYWETPPVYIAVGAIKAVIATFFILGEPHLITRDKIKGELVLSGIQDTEGLIVETWLESPIGEITELQTFDIESLEADETQTYEIELTPEEKGLNIVHAYLYDGARRLDYKSDYVYLD